MGELQQQEISLDQVEGHGGFIMFYLQWGSVLGLNTWKPQNPKTQSV